VNKKAIKKYANKCFLCPVDDYELLDVHRIYDGAYGGLYVPVNSLVLCANCHRLTHAGKIQIIKKHASYGKNLYMVECIIDGKNQFLPCDY
jgi:hypothetical protein